MRRYVITLLLILFAATSFADNEILYIFRHDGSLNGVYSANITDMRYSRVDFDGVVHDDYVMQEIVMGDSILRIPLAEIDSMTYKRPETEYQPDVVRIDERYEQYLIGSEGTTIYFSSDLPSELRFKPGEVLLYEHLTSLMPNGFAARCQSISTTRLANGRNAIAFECSEVKAQEVLRRFVFYREYKIVGSEEGSKSKVRLVEIPPTQPSLSRSTGSESHAQKRAIDGEVDEFTWNTSLSFDHIWYPLGKDETSSTNHHAANLSLAVKGGVDMKLTFAANFGISVFEENWLFIKAVPDITANIEVVAEAKYEYSHGKDPTKIELIGYKDMDGTPVITLAECEVPIPEVPVLSVGLDLGFFVKKTFEAEFKVSAEGKINMSAMCLFYNGDWQFARPVSDPSFEWNVSGELKGQLWGGLCLGVNAGITGKLLRENISVYAGPAVEGDVKVDFTKDHVYDAIKDSRFRAGLKVDSKASLDAKSFNSKWVWDQLKTDSKDWYFQRELYIVPQFGTIEYNKHNNTLNVSCDVTRNVIPQKIGFALYDENKQLVAKQMRNEYYSLKSLMPDKLRATFEGLDFANHCYRIVPMINNLMLLGDRETSESVWTTCPDHRHPHEIDLGLASGTKWSCMNIGADAPYHAGSYFAWGEPKSNMSKFYSTANWMWKGGIDSKSGMVDDTYYIGTKYDPATYNMKDGWCLPTYTQMEELTSRTKPTTLHGNSSPLGDEDAYALRGPSGQILTIPATGYIDGTTKLLTNYGYLWMGSIEKPITTPSVTNVGQFGGVSLTGHIEPYMGVNARGVRCQQNYDIEVLPATIDFGATGKQGKTVRNATVRNRQKSEIVIEASIPSATGKNCPFSLPNGNKIYVPAGGSRDIAVEFDASKANANNSTAALRLTSPSTPSFNWTIGMKASAEDNQSMLSPSALSFEGVIVGLKKKLSVTIRNTQTQPFEYYVVLTEANGTKAFNTQKAAWKKFTVKPGEQEVFDIVFAPKNTGSYTADLLFTISGASKTSTIHITGTGLPRTDTSDMIDLGLPSGLLWSSCNLGAAAPEDFGELYAWGCTETQSWFSWPTYKYCNGSLNTLTKYCSSAEYGKVDNRTILESGDDPAYKFYMGKRRVPSLEEFDELIKYCDTEWATLNDVKGYKFTSRKNGKSIFMPAAGRMTCDNNIRENIEGDYWANTVSNQYARFAKFSAEGIQTNVGIGRSNGLSIRPVADKK